MKIYSSKRMNRCELQNSLKKVLCPSTNSSKHYVWNIQQNQDETKHMPLPTPTILELWSSCHPPTCPCQWVFFGPMCFPCKVSMACCTHFSFSTQQCGPHMDMHRQLQHRHRFISVMHCKQLCSAWYPVITSVKEHNCCRNTHILECDQHHPATKPIGGFISCLLCQARYHPHHQPKQF